MQQQAKVVTLISQFLVVRMQTVALSHPLPAQLPHILEFLVVALQIPLHCSLSQRGKAPHPCHQCSPTKKSATHLVGGKHAFDSPHSTCPSKRSPLQHPPIIPTFANPHQTNDLYSSGRFSTLLRLSVSRNKQSTLRDANLSPLPTRSSSSPPTAVLKSCPHPTWRKTQPWSVISRSLGEAMVGS